jgi:putative ABC transport system ATP-binding protein
LQQAKYLLEQLHLPSDRLEQPVSELSIGQQQRVAAARALIGQPELLIADEPTSALDHDNRQAFIELLMDQASQANSTLIFVSHDPSLEPLFSKTIHLDAINQAGGATV